MLVLVYFQNGQCQDGRKFQNYKRVKIRKSKENDALAEKHNLIFNFTEMNEILYFDP